MLFLSVDESIQGDFFHNLIRNVENNKRRAVVMLFHYPADVFASEGEVSRSVIEFKLIWQVYIDRFFCVIIVILWLDQSWLGNDIWWFILDAQDQNLSEAIDHYLPRSILLHFLIKTLH